MIYFTSDWHIGEKSAPDTPSYLRPRPTDLMVREWLLECHQSIKPDDTFVFLGDIGLTINDVGLLHLLPDCHRILVLGNKETDNPNFKLSEFLELNDQLNIFDEVTNELELSVGDQSYYLSHKPVDCVLNTGGTDQPALCGHIHGMWRTQRMPNGQPIINVGIDAWHRLVSEELIAHQYTSVMERAYDVNCFPSNWT